MPATYGTGLYGDGTYGGSASVLPADPTNLNAVVVTSSQITLQWDDVAVNEQSYEVERHADSWSLGDPVYGVLGGTTLLSAPWVVIAVLAANTTTYADTLLAPGITYLYRVRARNAAGDSGYSLVLRITTLADSEPPVITSGPTVTGRSPTTLTIAWTTDEPADSQINYGTTTAYGTSTTLDPTLVLSHAQTLSSLNPSTTYFFEVISVDQTGNLYAVAPGVGDTTDPLPGSPPNAPSGLTATLNGAQRIDVAWTDNATTETGFSLERSTDNLTFVQRASLAANTTSYADSAPPLSFSTTYYYRVRAFNASGNSAYSNTAQQTTPAAPSPPAAPSALSGSAPSSSQINLTWTDNATNETNFELERATAVGGPFTQIALPAANSVSRADLTVLPSTQYFYRIRAVNADGPSAYATSAGITTPSAAGDTTPPVISGITATVTGSASATISWNTDEGSTTQVDYGLTPAYGTTTALNSSLVTTHSQPIGGLTASTPYYYRVRSTDAAGNTAQSGQQGPFTTNAPADVTPPVISNLQVTAVTSSSVTITWNTNEAATDVVDYGTTIGYGTSTSVDPTLRTVHARTVPSLLADTPYHFRVRSTDGSGNQQNSGDLQARTLAATGGTGTLPAPATNGTVMAGMQVLIALSSQPTDLPVWTDVTQWVSAVSFRRGKDSPLGAVSAATAEVTLRNEDRRFDPTNTSGPYYGSLKKLRRIKVRPGWQGAGYDQFTGYIDDWPLEWDGPAKATVTLPCTDGFAVLALCDLNRPFNAATGDVRIHEVLDEAGWTTGAGWMMGDLTQSVLGSTTILGSTGDRLISVADAQLVAADLRDTNALSHIQEVEASELGLFFMAKGGEARFRSRHELQQLTVGQGFAIFGEDLAGGELLYTDATVNAAGGLHYNRARITRPGAQAPEVFQDDASVFDYYARLYSTSVLLDNAPATQGYAQAIVGRYKTPFPVIPSLELDATYQPALVWPQVLGRELGECVTVRRRPPGGGPVLEQKSRILGISCTYVAGGAGRPDAASWAFSWRLEPVGQEGTPWVLADPVLSVLGSSTRLLY